MHPVDLVEHFFEDNFYHNEENILQIKIFFDNFPQNLAENSSNLENYKKKTDQLNSERIKSQHEILIENIKNDLNDDYKQNQIIFLMARIIKFYVFMQNFLNNMIFSRSFVFLDYELSSNDEEGFVFCNIKLGDSVEEIWTLFKMLLNLTEEFNDISILVKDNDEYFYLIYCDLPKWLNPINSDYRIFLRQGYISIINPIELNQNERISKLLNLEKIDNTKMDSEKIIVKKLKLKKALYFLKKHENILICPKINKKINELISDHDSIKTHNVMVMLPRGIKNMILFFNNLLNLALDNITASCGEQNEFDYIFNKKKTDDDKSEMTPIVLKLSRIDLAKINYLNLNLPKEYKDWYLNDDTILSPYGLGAIFCYGLQQAFRKNVINSKYAFFNYMEENIFETQDIKEQIKNFKNNPRFIAYCESWFHKDISPISENILRNWLIVKSELSFRELFLNFYNSLEDISYVENQEDNFDWLFKSENDEFLKNEKEKLKKFEDDKKNNFNDVVNNYIKGISDYEGNPILKPKKTNKKNFQCKDFNIDNDFNIWKEDDDLKKLIDIVTSVNKFEKKQNYQYDDDNDGDSDNDNDEDDNDEHYLKLF